MIKAIDRLRDVRRALGQGGYVISVREKEKGSRIHNTGCQSVQQLRKSFGARRRSKHEADIRYFHSKSLEEALLFWAFARVEPNITPCEECKPRGMKAPDIPDCDRELYDWMKSEEKTISNMRMLMYKFIDAYTIGKQNKDAFTFQARATRKMAESGQVRAVEISGDHKEDVDILLDDGSNIQIWYGKYESDYDGEEAGHGDSRVYRLRDIIVDAIRHKMDQLPGGKKGFVVNLVPGDTMGEPPRQLLTANKCVISSKDCKCATIYMAQNFKHIEDARRMCNYLDWKVVDEKEGMKSDFLVWLSEHVDGPKDELTVTKRTKAGQVSTQHIGIQKPIPAPADDSWCGCKEYVD